MTKSKDLGLLRCPKAASYKGKRAPTCGCRACEEVWQRARVERKWSRDSDYETINVNFDDGSDKALKRIAKKINFSVSELIEAMLVAHIVKAEMASGKVTK